MLNFLNIRETGWLIFNFFSSKIEPPPRGVKFTEQGQALENNLFRICNFKNCQNSN